MNKALLMLVFMSCLIGMLVAQVTNFPFFEGFEGVNFPPAGWVRAGEHSVAQGNWTPAGNVTDIPDLVKSGFYAAVSRSWLPPPPQLGTPINPNNWLITPQLAIPAESNFVLDFSVRSEITPQMLINLGIFIGEEQYSVYVSTTGNDMADFTEVLWNETFPPIGVRYQDRQIDLSPYAGQNIYIAFRHHDCEDNSLLALDDVFVGPQEPANPPINLVATTADSRATISWDTPEGGRTPSLYVVYQDGKEIGTTTSRNFSAQLLVNGIEYSFAVKAKYYFPMGESVLSETLMVTTTGPTIFPITPMNLTASQFDGNVTLSWEVPNLRPKLEDGGAFFFHPLPGIDAPDVIMTAGPGPAGGEIGMAQRFSPAHLTPVIGMRLAGVMFWTGPQNSIGTEFTFRVYQGGFSMNNPGTLVHEQYWGATTQDDINTFVELGFTQYVDILAGQELRVVLIANIKTHGHPLGFGQIFAVPQYGNLVYWQGEYSEINRSLPDVNGNANIGSYALDPEGRKVMLSDLLIIPDIASDDVKEVQSLHPSIPSRSGFLSTGTVASISDEYSEIGLSQANQIEGGATVALPPKTRNESTRNFVSYRVYRGEDTLLTTLEEPYTATTFTDYEAQGGLQTYYVSAYYEGVGESRKVPVRINVIPPTVISAYPFTEGFNSESFPPSGWILHSNAAGGRNWFRMSGQSSHEGTGTAASISWLAMEPNIEPDNWLISPRFEVPESGPFGLRYYVGAQDGARYEEHYSILVSRTTPRYTDFTEELFSETLGTNEWQEREFNLTRFAGETIILAFRHHSCSGQHTLKIDSILVDIMVNDGDKPHELFKTNLTGNYPNPFNPSTVISFDVAVESIVSIDIYNIRGQKVKTLVNEPYGVGSYVVEWNGNDENDSSVASGIYFYQMRAGEFSAIRRMVLLK